MCGSVSQCVAVCCRVGVCFCTEICAYRYQPVYPRTCVLVCVHMPASLRVCVFVIFECTARREETLLTGHVRDTTRDCSVVVHDTSSHMTRHLTWHVISHDTSETRHVISRRDTTQSCARLRVTWLISYVWRDPSPLIGEGYKSQIIGAFISFVRKPEPGMIVKGLVDQRDRAWGLFFYPPVFLFTLHTRGSAWPSVWCFSFFPLHSFFDIHFAFMHQPDRAWCLCPPSFLIYAVG